ncbi:MAG: hypothetical protein KDB22_13550 [Planctomycetales bacterium]|nr:hypothetical protein [Planctomycetales bacterium]
MTSIFSAKKLCAAAVLAFAGIGTNVASAGDYGACCHYETVVSHKTVLEPVVHYVTKYTDCGHPYRAKVVTYKKVTVPVVRKVLVCH